MNRNSPHTNRKKKPSATKNPVQSDSVSHSRHAPARFMVGILNSAPLWTKCLKCRGWCSKSSLDSLVNSSLKCHENYYKQDKHVHKHAHFSTLKGHSTLACILLLCHLNNASKCSFTKCCIAVDCLTLRLCVLVGMESNKAVHARFLFTLLVWRKTKQHAHTKESTFSFVVFAPFSLTT